MRSAGLQLDMELRRVLLMKRRKTGRRRLCRGHQNGEVDRRCKLEEGDGGIVMLSATRLEEVVGWWRFEGR